MRRGPENMGELMSQAMGGSIPTPTMGSQMAPPKAFHSVPVGAPSRAEILRAMEGLALLQVGSASGRVNIPLAEREGLAGRHGPAAKAVWVALGRALSVAPEHPPGGVDSSLSEWERRGCPVA